MNAIAQLWPLDIARLGGAKPHRARQAPPILFGLTPRSAVAGSCSFLIRPIVRLRSACIARDNLLGSKYYKPERRAGLSSMILAPRMYRRRISNDLWPVWRMITEWQANKRESSACNAPASKPGYFLRRRETRSCTVATTSRLMSAVLDPI